MRRYPPIVLAIFIIAATMFVYTSTERLPDLIATHFGAGNRADAWVTRDDYRLTLIAILVAFPMLMALLMGFLPRRFPRWTNIPNREYWLAPERQTESVRFLFAHGCWLGCLIVLMIVGAHYAILAAHRSAPPMLPLAVFLPMIVGFLLSVVVWIGIFYWRFRRPPKVLRLRGHGASEPRRRYRNQKGNFNATDATY
jgi:uncharacterized membrane protein